MEEKEKIYPKGLIWKRPREGAPDFIKGSMSIKVDEFVAFLQKHSNKGWVNLDFKKSKEKGTLYFQLDDWKPKPKDQETINPDDVPFN